MSPPKVVTVSIAMKQRFEPPEGTANVIEVLRANSIIEGDIKAARAIAESASIKGYAAGEVLMQQGGKENHVAFLLSGTVEVIVKGQQIRDRDAPTQVGEMALVDPKAVRSATVRAKTEVVTAEVSEPDFAAIADCHPRMWRLIAVELAERLRQRNVLVKQRNDVPVIFIGSSSESLPIAQVLSAALLPHRWDVRLWTVDVFQASRFPIEDLAAQAAIADFAVLVLGPDDRLKSRGRRFRTPRDNVVFELGLFMGALGRERSYLLRPRGMHLKIPSDLDGIGMLEHHYMSRKRGALATLVRMVTLGGRKAAAPTPDCVNRTCEILRERVTKMGPR